MTLEDKIDIVASNYAENDVDYSGIISSIAKGDLTLNGYKLLLRSLYKQGFKRGVEKAKKNNEAAWIDNQVCCTCGNCGYNHIAKTNFCPNCGYSMNLEFKSNEARRFYEQFALERIRRSSKEFERSDNDKC